MGSSLDGSLRTAGNKTTFTILPVFYREGDCTTLIAQGLKGIQSTFKSMYSKQNRPILHLTFISCGRKAFSYNPWLKAADIWYWLCLRQMPCAWIFLFVSLPSKHRSTHSFTRQSLPCGFCVSSSSVDSSLWNWTKNFILGMNTIKLQYTHWFESAVLRVHNVKFSIDLIDVSFQQLHTLCVILQLTNCSITRDPQLIS